MRGSSSLLQQFRASKNLIQQARTQLPFAYESWSSEYHHGASNFFYNSAWKRPRSSMRSICSSSNHFSANDPYVSDHFRLSNGEVESYLKRTRLEYRRSGDFETVKECPFCHDTKNDPSNMYALKISTISGYYKCFRCGAKGSWFNFKRRLGFGNEDITSMQSSKRNSLNSTPIELDDQTPSMALQQAYVKNIMQSGSEVRNYLHSRRLTDETIKHFGVGSTTFKIHDGFKFDSHRCVSFPMYGQDKKLVRYKLRSTKTKRGMRLDPKGGAWGFFGLDKVPDDAEEIIITEGEIDAMSVYQSTGRPTISLPNGANSLHVSLLPALERFKTIYLWMDEDSVGQAGAQQFSRKLGLRRCLSVRGLTPDGKKCKDANEALQEGIDLSQLLDAATVVKHDAILQFDDLRQQVFHELTNAHDNSIIQCQSMPKLNQFIKGHRRGELTIFTGHTGVGKTTLISQLSLDYCRQGVATLWGSFEIANVRLASRMLRQFSEMENNGKSLVDDYDYWADRFAELPMYFMRYHGSNPTDQILDTMEYANYVHDCSHIILDNLQFLTYGQETKSTFSRFADRFEVMDNAVAQIRQFCTSSNSHTTLVVHPRKEDDDSKIQTASVFGSAKATQEADNVIILQRTVDGPQLEVKKNRHDGNLGSIALKFDPKRLHFYERDSPGFMNLPSVVPRKVEKPREKNSTHSRQAEKEKNNNRISEMKNSTTNKPLAKQAEVSVVKGTKVRASKSSGKETSKRVTFRKTKGERPSIINTVTDTEISTGLGSIDTDKASNSIDCSDDNISLKGKAVSANETLNKAISHHTDKPVVKQSEEINNVQDKTQQHWSGL